MVKTRYQKAVEARALNDLRLAFKIDEIREAIFGLWFHRSGTTRLTGSDVQTARFKNRGLLIGKLKTASGSGKGGEDKRKAVTRSLYYKQREEAQIEEVLKKLQELSKLVRTNAVDSHSGVEGFVGPSSYKVDALLLISMVSTSGCAMADEVDLVGHLSPVIGVGDEEDTIAELVEWPRLKGSRVEYPTGSSQFRKFCKAKSSIDGIWGCAFGYRGNFFGTCSVSQGGDYLYLLPDLAKEKKCKHFGDEVSLEYVQGVVKDSRTGISCKVSRKESFIDVAAREGTGLEVVLKELEISRFKRVASKDDKVRRSQAKRRMAGKTPGTIMRRKVTSPIKLQVVLEESDKIAEGADLRPYFEVEAGLLEEQCRAKALEKMVDVVDDEFKKFARALRGVQLGLQDRSIELEKRISSSRERKTSLKEPDLGKGSFSVGAGEEREAAALKLKEVRAKSVAEAERMVTASATSRNNLVGKLNQLRYTKAEILAFSKGNYEVKEIMDEEVVEEVEDGLNVAEKTAVDNQETIDQKELEVAREREEQILLYNAEYAEEYVALISQYEDRLDDNVKFSLKLEEAKSQVEDMTAIILSGNLALNQLTNELAELKEKDVSSSRHEAELAEYRIRTLNDEISDMKCNIRALNEQLLKKEIDLDTARTDLAVSETDLEKLNNSITGKDLELRNSAEIRYSLIARLDRLKADLRRLKGREAQSRADLAEVQAKNKGLVDDLAHTRRNVRRVVQRDKEMNERINQLCA
ncbi:hypothetical protein GIB67_009018 [Kingdonia uniflora]|uniref:Uncharacterized protein n=1 Tax=Kingdonia uniflora TaxID=39325 RepID=A0A7J7LVZ4_9MAGN|nr:hypothetical protein GIB67_009018 [Kingdonia uniflora]